MAKENTTRAPEWTIEEFDWLLSNPQLTDQQVAEHVLNRSSGAIGVVRSGIHSFHQGGNVSMLSQMMLARLQAGSVVYCPLCGAAIQTAAEVETAT